MGLTSEVKNLSKAMVIFFLRLHVDWLGKKIKKIGGGPQSSLCGAEKPRVLKAAVLQEMFRIADLKAQFKPFLIL